MINLTPWIMMFFVGAIIVIMLVLVVPDLMRMLIFPAALVIAFLFYQIAGIEAAAIAVIFGILAVIANPKPPGGYWGQQ